MTTSVSSSIPDVVTTAERRDRPALACRPARPHRVAVGPALRGARRSCCRAVRRLPVRAASSTTPSRAGTGSARPSGSASTTSACCWTTRLPPGAAQQLPVRAVGADPGDAAADRSPTLIHVRIPGWRSSGRPFFLPAVYRDGRDRHRRLRARSSSTARSTRCSGRSASSRLQREWLGSSHTSIPADPARRRLDELRLQRADLPGRHERARSRRSRRPPGSTERARARILVSRRRAQPAAGDGDRARHLHTSRRSRSCSPTST